jgi:uncharacterized protein (TIGR02391 family)
MKQKTKTDLIASPSDELAQIAVRLSAQAEKGLDPEVTGPIQSLREAINKIAKSFSGSWLGYHACVYYDGFKSPPPGAHFSKEWGLRQFNGDMGTKGIWREYDPEEVKNNIYTLAGNPNIELIREILKESEPAFKNARSEIISIVSSDLYNNNDDYLYSLLEEVKNIEYLDKGKILRKMVGTGKFTTQDTRAAEQGIRYPPHKVVDAETIELHNATALLVELSNISKKINSHLLRRKNNTTTRVSAEFHFEDLLHPLIKINCYQLLKDGHYRESVFNSITAIYDFIRERSKSGEDGDKLIGQVFSLDNPVLILSDLETESGRNDQKGFMQIFKGAYQGIRNPKAHSLMHDLTATKTAQHLIFASLLARRIEDARVAGPISTP